MMKHPLFHGFLFCLGLVLFNWPFLSIAGGKSTACFFIYLFLVWLLIILSLFLTGRRRGEGPTDRDEPPENGRSHDV